MFKLSIIQKYSFINILGFMDTTACIYVGVQETPRLYHYIDDLVPWYCLTFNITTNFLHMIEYSWKIYVYLGAYMFLLLTQYQLVQYIYRVVA